MTDQLARLTAALAGRDSVGTVAAEGRQFPTTHMRRRLALSALLTPCLVWGCVSSSGPANYAPKVSITTPLSGARVPRGETVGFEVSASDPDGAVVAVRLIADDRLLGVDSASPYRFEWDTHGEEVGGHVVRAAAIDDRGQTAGAEIDLWIRWTDVAPEQLDDGWQTSTLAAEQIDADRMTWMMDLIAGEGYGFLHAVLVARNGKLVFEEYFGGFGRDSLQHLQSTTKSFTSALIGIAIDRGEIGSVHDPMFDYLPDYASLRDTANERITIEHCLMMAAGLEWNEITVPVLDPTNDNIRGHLVSDYVAYLLGKPVVAEPGTVWYYNSGCSMALGAVLRTATGVPADVYAAQRLFAPLGISRFVWETINGGKHVGTHGSLYLRPRDMAKFGRLFLQRGAWNGAQVVSADWVAESTRPRLTVSGDLRYGYQWWFEELRGHDVPFTSGYGGQHIFVVPDLSAVIVTAASYDDGGSMAEQDNRIIALVRDRILPALLPASPVTSGPSRAVVGGNRLP